MKSVESSFQYWLIWLCCIYAFLLPVSAKAASVSFAALILVSLIYKIRNRTFFRFSSPVMFWMLLFYVLHLTGLIYTGNFKYASLDLQIKASFLLMPLFVDNYFFQPASFRKIGRAFVTGCTLYSLILLFNAFLEYFLWHDRSSFFYIDFSSQRHVAYLTLYLNLSIFLLFDEFMRKPGYTVKSRYFLSLWIIFIAVIITLLSSRMALFAAFISFTLYIFLNVKRSGMIKALVASGSAALVMVIIYFFITGSRNRFEQAVPASIAQEAYPVASSSVRSNVRFTAWKNTLQVYASSPVIGVGTGDIKDELISRYRKNNFQEGIDFNLSPHNQFLHTLTALGIPGLLSLLLMFRTAMKSSFRKSDHLVIVFCVAVLLNFMTEGILEKQDGVLFVAFFLVLLTGRLQESQMKSASI